MTSGESLNVSLFAIQTGQIVGSQTVGYITDSDTDLIQLLFGLCY